MEKDKGHELPNGQIFCHQIFDLLDFTDQERLQAMQVEDHILCYMGAKDHPRLYHEAIIGNIERVIWINEGNLSSYQEADDPFVLDFKCAFEHIAFIELHFDYQRATLMQASHLIRTIKQTDISALLLAMPGEPKHALTATTGLMGRVVDHRGGYVVRVYY